VCKKCGRRYGGNMEWFLFDSNSMNSSRGRQEGRRAAAMRIPGQLNLAGARRLTPGYVAVSDRHRGHQFLHLTSRTQRNGPVIESLNWNPTFFLIIGFAQSLTIHCCAKRLKSFDSNLGELTRLDGKFTLDWNQIWRWWESYMWWLSLWSIHAEMFESFNEIRIEVMRKTFTCSNRKDKIKLWHLMSCRFRFVPCNSQRSFSFQKNLNRFIRFSARTKLQKEKFSLKSSLRCKRKVSQSPLQSC
jgi:hypothetical protein